jgi:large subunit ribosomal protein L4
MASLPVYDKSGKEIGTYEIDPADIAATINKQLLHDVVLMYQANQRQGSHKSKGRSEVAGSTKKLYRQKGTGNARAGGRRTNIRRGGGHTFALKNRDYSYRLPRKAIRLATRMAMAGKIIDNQVVVIDGLSMSEPKTSEIATLLSALGLVGKSTLIATADHSPVVYKSARNIERVSVSPVGDLNALEILKPHRLLITKEAIERFKEFAAAENARSNSNGNRRKTADSAPSRAGRE